MKFSDVNPVINTGYFNLVNKVILSNGKTCSLYLFAIIKQVPTAPITILTGLKTNNSSVEIGAITDGFGVPLKLISAMLENGKLNLNQGQIAQFTGYMGYYIMFNFSYSVI